ncbi:hypothetical protein AFLA_011946 [Aspergillus flavus NRRL3357]|nr:hypothetical protein AFLA_011946 [Aspergillus flavus NRRL3357]
MDSRRETIDNLEPTDSAEWRDTDRCRGSRPISSSDGGCVTDDGGGCKISHHEWEISSVFDGKNFVDHPRPSGGLSLVAVTFGLIYRDLGNVLGPVYVENLAQSRHPAYYTGGEEVLE